MVIDRNTHNRVRSLVLEKFLLRTYRRLVPARLRRRIPQDLKNRILLSLMLVTQRDIATLRLRRVARRAGRAGKWAKSVRHWQKLATMLAPVNVQIQQRKPDKAGPQLPSDTVFEALPASASAPLPADLERKFKYAKTELMRARVHHALQLHAQGQRRAFRENLSRAIEFLPDQRVFKKERYIVDAVRLYVQDALIEDQGLSGPQPIALPPEQPLKIAICLDVLKLSDVHTHARVVFAICRNLMRLNPQIETHIIVTNERFCVTTPIIGDSGHPARAEQMRAYAKQALPDHYGTQFFLHVFNRPGLSGVVASCQDILKIAPDVLLFGGGHKGYYSNESRVVRHCLFDHLPTAFFFIQSNNEVDEKNDLIIARGPHPILGDPGQTELRIQPYPTITQDNIPEMIRKDSPAEKIIVSAITGVRMNQKMAEQSDADMRAFFSILDQTPGAVWHFIGAAHPQELIAANKHIARRVAAGQVVVHPVLSMAEFTALVQKSALFLHLPGFTGGSGGATVARRAGIPILTFRHSDVSGRQPQSTIFEASDVAGFVAQALRLLHDPSAWADTVQQQFDHTRWIRQTSAQGFYDCLTRAHQIGIARINAKAGAKHGT